MKLEKIIVLVFSIALVCQAAVAQTSFERVPLSSDSDLTKSVQIYPNPATDFVNIKLELPLAKRLKLNIYNIIGSSVEAESEVIDDFEIRIKTKDLPVGYYMIALREGDLAVRATYKFSKR
jgi:hypothetical protein